jgi:hypothetical protein
MTRTAAEAFGPEITDRLAKMAIDLLCAAPEVATTQMTRVPAALVREGREILDDAGIDWRGLVRGRVAREREAAGDVRRRKLEREAAKRSSEDLRALLDRLDGSQAPLQIEVIEAELARRTPASTRPS